MPDPTTHEHEPPQHEASAPKSIDNGLSRHDGLSRDDEQRLAELLDEYVAALERGEAPTFDELANRCPELAEVLPGYLDGVRLLHGAMGAASDASVPASTPLPKKTAVEKQLGDYELIHEIGRGGMGVVYEARQASLNRRVAVKVLPFAAVLDERQIARFHTEAQAAAALNHPNIVPVFAVGQERGVHFYAMQYVDGQSLGQAIEELRLAQPADATAGALPETPGIGRASTVDEKNPAGPLATAGTTRESSYFRAVAQLGVQAAEALDHAHQYGVVHRDIKPTNLLVDNQGKLWVTDFGLARVQTDRSVTRSGDVIGTLRYMSPEQAKGRGDLVDGRTDVYALGATLYETLTLQPAHAGDDAHTIAKRIESNEPTPPRRLNPAIPVDLETIVLRAMEKSRDDRYASAQELSDDLQRFLDGRPTAARRAGVIDRTCKWLARRRGLAAGVAAALIVVTLVSVVSAVRVAAAGQHARAALQKAQANLALAQSHYRQARSAVDHFGGDVADRLAELPGSDRLRRELLSDTLAYYQEFLKSADSDPALRNDLAATHFKSGAIAHRLGDLAGARRSYQTAVSQWRSLADPQNTPAGDSAAEGPLLVLGLRRLAGIESEAGAHDAASQYFAEAVAIARTLVRKNPEEARYLSALAETLANQGIARRATNEAVQGTAEIREAVVWFNKALLIDRDRHADLRALAVAHSNLSELLRTRSPTEAYKSSKLAVAVLERLVADRPEQTSYRADLAMACNNLAALEGARGNWDRAAVGYQQAAEETQRLVQRDPLLPRNRRELAITHSNLALAMSRVGKHDASDTAFAKAATTIEALIKDFPGRPAYAVSLAALWNNRGVALQKSGRHKQALDAFALAVNQHKKSDAVGHNARSAVTKSYRNYASALRKAGELGQAEAVDAELRTLFSTAPSSAEEPPRITAAALR